MADRSKRQEGFPGQRQVILPQSVQVSAARDPLLKSLCPLRAGFYPHAVGHLVNRARGCPEFLILACVAGRGTVRLGSRWWRLEPGAAAVLPPGKPHAYLADARSPWTLEWLHLAGREVAEYAALAGLQPHTPILALPGEDTGLSGVLALLEQGYERRNLLAAALQCRQMFLRWGRDGRALSATGRIDRSIVAMRQTLQTDPSLTALAAASGLSVPHYRHLFRERTGYPPIEYFHRLRIQEASRLLVTTPAQIQEIAARVGYPDPYYFSRVFKRVMAMGPREFRTRMTEGVRPPSAAASAAVSDR